MLQSLYMSIYSLSGNAPGCAPGIDKGVKVAMCPYAP